MVGESNIRWPCFDLIYVHSLAVYRRLGNLANVGMSGCSSPQDPANSYCFILCTSIRKYLLVDSPISLKIYSDTTAIIK